MQKIVCELPEHLLQLTSEFSKVPEDMLNIQQSFVFLCIRSEVKNQHHSQQYKIYLRMKLAEYMQDVYAENHKHF